MNTCKHITVPGILFRVIFVVSAGYIDPSKQPSKVRAPDQTHINATLPPRVHAWWFPRASLHGACLPCKGEFLSPKHNMVSPSREIYPTNAKPPLKETRH